MRQLDDLVMRYACTQTATAFNHIHLFIFIYVGFFLYFNFFFYENWMWCTWRRSTTNMNMSEEQYCLNYTLLLYIYIVYVGHNILFH